MFTEDNINFTLYLLNINFGEDKIFYSPTKSNFTAEYFNES